MPRVKLDYIVSVSSEDPEYLANNLLAGEVSKKKWLCSKNEHSCSVVLQLVRAVTISAVHVGAQHAAFIEVLVGSSEKPNDQYEVLVPRCVFCTPAESRRDEPVPRVRTFSGAQLAEGARRRRWDRVRVSCTQPYNKHCQFGLSFVHIFEPEGALAQPSDELVPTPSHVSLSAVKDKFLTLGNYSSDDDDFQPGELFTMHRQRLSQDNKTAHSAPTDAQIRQASSQALKNITDESTKIIKAQFARSSNKREERDLADGSRAVTRSPVEALGRAAAAAEPPRSKHQRDAATPTDEVTHERGRDRAARAPAREQPAEAGNRKRKRSRDDRRNGDGSGAAAARALRGVVFAMSGYVHPERAALRDAGLRLGARYRPDWTSDCTHLVCAFPNTPKMKKVVVSAAHAHVVSGGWLRECSARRRRVSEAPYSLRATGSPAGASPAPPAPARTRPTDGEPSRRSEQEGDTDDEIEKVRARSRQARARASSDDPMSDLDDVTLERIKGSVSLPDSEDETTEEAGDALDMTENPTDELPDLLEGRSVLIAKDVCVAGMDAALLARYVQAYGGLPLREEEVEEDATVDYALCASDTGARGLRMRVHRARLRADWLWGCHRARALLPTRPYTLPT